MAGLSGHSLAYRFPFDRAGLAASADWRALIEPRRIGLASCAGLPNAADRFSYGAGASGAGVRGPWRVSLASWEPCGQEGKESLLGGK